MENGYTATSKALAKAEMERRQKGFWGNVID